MWTTVLLVVHLMIAAALVAVVLLQRSEGGALGIGGGGSGGGFLTGRGTANLLTRSTAALAVAFFTTSILLSILAQQARAPTSVFDRPGAAGTAAPAAKDAPPAAPVPEGRGGVLDKLQPPGAPAVPQSK